MSSTPLTEASFLEYASWLRELAHHLVRDPHNQTLGWREVQGLLDQRRCRVNPLLQERRDRRHEAARPQRWLRDCGALRY